MIKYKPFQLSLLFISMLFFGCHQNDIIEIVKSYLDAINKRDIEKVKQLLSNDIEYWTWELKNGKLTSIKDTNQFTTARNLKDYNFLDVQFSIISIRKKGDLVKTRESVNSDIFRLMRNIKYQTKLETQEKYLFF
jgi:limonene-1,2-epoxide hydrolase